LWQITLSRNINIEDYIDLYNLYKKIYKFESKKEFYNIVLHKFKQIEKICPKTDKIIYLYRGTTKFSNDNDRGNYRGISNNTGLLCFSNHPNYCLLYAYNYLSKIIVPKGTSVISDNLSEPFIILANNNSFELVKEFKYDTTIGTSYGYKNNFRIKFFIYDYKPNNYKSDDYIIKYNKPPKIIDNVTDFYELNILFPDFYNNFKQKFPRLRLNQTSIEQIIYYNKESINNQRLYYNKIVHTPSTLKLKLFKKDLNSEYLKSDEYIYFYSYSVRSNNEYNFNIGLVNNMPWNYDILYRISVVDLKNFNLKKINITKSRAQICYNVTFKNSSIKELKINNNFIVANVKPFLEDAFYSHLPIKIYNVQIV